MSYPYGRRELVDLEESLVVTWKDGYAKRKAEFVKARIQFNGNKVHCGRKVVKWLLENDFVKPRDLLFVNLKKKEEEIELGAKLDT